MEAEQVNLLTGIKPHSFWISRHVKTLYLLQHKAGDLMFIPAWHFNEQLIFFLEWTKTKEKI